MDETAALSADQTKQIEETLKRIRDGLKIYPNAGAHEPIHIFLSEVLDATKS